MTITSTGSSGGGGLIGLASAARVDLSVDSMGVPGIDREVHLEITTEASDGSNPAGDTRSAHVGPNTGRIARTGPLDC